MIVILLIFNKDYTKDKGKELPFFFKEKYVKIQLKK